MEQLRVHATKKDTHIAIVVQVVHMHQVRLVHTEHPVQCLRNVVAVQPQEHVIPVRLAQILVVVVRFHQVVAVRRRLVM